MGPSRESGNRRRDAVPAKSRNPAFAGATGIDVFPPYRSADLDPGAQVAAAIDILAEIEGGGRPADDTAADYFRRRRYIGAKDRAQIAGHVYAALGTAPRSTGGSRGSATARRARGPQPGAGRSRAGRGLAAEGGDGSVRRRPVSPRRLNAAEARLIDGLGGRTLRHPEMPRAVANDVPEWLEPYLERAFGKGLEREMAALNAAAPIDLRVNLLKASRETARRALAMEGVATEPTPLSPVGLRLKKRVPLSGLAAFKDGLFDVQDEGSQIAALMAGARPGMRVVDFCAGAGGKTLALAAGMANRGKLVACDVSARRLERAARRLRRAGVANVERRALSSENDKWVKRHAGGFDRVLVDAPCLGTGTWRRNPDAKWRSRPQDLAELVERQQQILRGAARLVRPGGGSSTSPARCCAKRTRPRPTPFSPRSPISRWFRRRARAGTIGGASPGGDAIFFYPGTPWHRRIFRRRFRAAGR